MTTNGRTKDGNNPRSVQRFERAILIGIPSADFIKASGHSTARQAGHMEATDQVISTSKNPCLRGAIHIWTLPYPFANHNALAIRRRYHIGIYADQIKFRGEFVHQKTPVPKRYLHGHASYNAVTANIRKSKCRSSG
jgi:hypothetical protein